MTRFPITFCYASHHILPCCYPHRCYVDDRVSKVAWLNRSNIIFASQDKWSLDPRVDLVTKGQLEYSLRIQKVTQIAKCYHALYCNNLLRDVIHCTDT